MLRSCPAMCLLLAFRCSFVTPGSVGGNTPLLTAKEIVERYDKALGGRDALLRHSSSTMRGTLQVYEAGKVEKVPFVYFAGAPYRRLEKVLLPNGAGEILNGFDGETAWSFDPSNGAKVYAGDEWQSMKRDADFYYALNELSWFKSMEMVGIEDFEGRTCYRLHGINNWNKANDHFYDRETGLLAGYEFNSELGPTREIFSEYKKVDGVLVPTKQLVKAKSSAGSWDLRQVLNFESVTFNDVDAAVFTPPQAVRELLKNGETFRPDASHHF
jgi:hypothetical protein